ncbi:DUF1669 domain-containing protein [Tenacibaculum finnmarkense genomovar finnmarkense]|uniref:phospholipase D-like domain-containing protein n=1 Tax=Tenacibaculum finnmarkense TaxID=2781243 RepID=UPI001E574070|nr:phospholipase D-like domain-containing protein [Tenacibaculum finnmarkense]MCD8417424.1 phospholipase D-like domain-containing protein [Tenacibaculum finnmarkense genomovar finnmarkense]MCG8185682.1 DUF1669 domain-containing protein [Tenacibaculum finnmarkense genomovar finnmarkense]MCG8202235.1 DUF1669 domain-containing protein [Tenacibaculum finnmarkense genomovar finnmarkense]MCG8209761.1 DUF1669 domain-containing protein [Tenacibaculum finnmarkense genomovar finnmarkense]MCG8212435.1 DU
MQTEGVFENIAERIAEELQKAEKTIYIAIAWFTNKELFDILKTKAQNNCTVFIIINDDEINNNSKINYNQLDIYNLNVFKINDTELMHNKFCIIDDKTVITGSYNWSYKAKTNFENIIVTYNDTILTQQFIEEFNRILKIISPKKIIKNEPFPVHIIVKRLEIIKNYLFLEDDEAVINECQKLEKYNFNTDITKILKIVQSEESYSGIAIIDEFISKNQQIKLWIDKELSLLKRGIRKLENQVNAFDNEKIEIEKILADFQNQHSLELGEVILKILQLRKLISSENKEKYEEAKEEEKEYQDYYDSEKKKDIKIINDEQKKELKKKFRKATILCHPDKFSNEPEEVQKQAEEIFKELNDANAKNDVERVKEILANLEKGILKSGKESVSDKEILRATINRLKIKLKQLEKEILEIKQSETYKTVISIDNWSEYFYETRASLKLELQRLKEEIEVK